MPSSGCAHSPVRKKAGQSIQNGYFIRHGICRSAFIYLIPRVILYYRNSEQSAEPSLASLSRHAYSVILIDTEYYETFSIIYFSLCRHKKEKERIYNRIGRFTGNDDTARHAVILQPSAARGRAGVAGFMNDQCASSRGAEAALKREDSKSANERPRAPTRSGGA